MAQLILSDTIIETMILDYFGLSMYLYNWVLLSSIISIQLNTSKKSLLGRIWHRIILGERRQGLYIVILQPWRP